MYRENRWLICKVPILKLKRTKRHFNASRSSNLWPVLWLPHQRSYAADGPEQESHRNSSERFYYHHWLCRKRGSSGHHRRFCVLQPFCDPTGPPTTEYRPASESERKRQRVMCIFMFKDLKTGLRTWVNNKIYIKGIYKVSKWPGKKFSRKI